MNRLAFAVLTFLFAVPSSFAQIGFSGPDALPKASITGSLHQRTGNEVQGTISATIAEGWHVNSNTPTEDFAIRTELRLDPATAELIGDPVYPPGAMKAFQFSAGSQLSVYDGTVPIPFRAKLKPGATKIGAILRYQACSDSVCLPPKRATVDIDVNQLTAAPAATPDRRVRPRLASFPEPR